MWQRGTSRLQVAAACRRLVELLPQSPQMAIERAYYRKTHEPELRLLPYLCSGDTTAVDVGANKGIYSLFLVHYAAHLVCVEPNPFLSAYLERKFKGLAVDVINCALGNHVGSTSLTIPYLGDYPLSGWASLVADFAEAQFEGEVITRTEQIEVEVTRLDDLSLPTVGFIKIDVEGYESEVIAGAHKTIQRDLPRLLVEMERRLNPEMESTVGRILNMGYQGYFLQAGRIRPIAEFDPDRMQRAHDVGDSRTHVSNFIFAPAGAPLQLPRTVYRTEG